MIDTLPTAEPTAGTPLSLFSLAVQLGDCSPPYLPITFVKNVALNILNCAELRGETAKEAGGETWRKTMWDKTNTGGSKHSMNCFNAG